MKRSIILIAIAVLTLALAGTAAAGCAYCVTSVTAQTRDGGEWRSGEPVRLVFEVARSDASAAFPAEASGVVMELDRERIKCLDVQLRKIAEDGDTARYAGLFYPFHAGVFDGRVSIGESAQDFEFSVLGGSAARTEEAPAAQAAPSTLPPLAAGASALAALALSAALLARRRLIAR